MRLGSYAGPSSAAHGTNPKSLSYSTPQHNMGKIIFSMPRNDEIVYENNLIANKKKFWD